MLLRFVRHIKGVDDEEEINKFNDDSFYFFSPSFLKKKLHFFVEYFEASTTKSLIEFVAKLVRGMEETRKEKFKLNSLLHLDWPQSYKPFLTRNAQCVSE